ncbi:hypothetical protein [Actinomadura sp. NEAU-AAG7]|uniref:hypothetical protein n=1 Tax=Actinomadura sp. NEAU-AAG7 TaxID=2839640 RepID=UPI001BE4B0AF|nr:hypothetical protein [Actinomadura sp. NEAU-AAG7]MBT2213489.1 hypothetical protein [Actinomadura sp. NEAU-AAG7]
MAWFGLDGTLITPEQAKALMEDVEARTAARDVIAIRPGLTVEVRTTFVVYAETDDQGHPTTPLWATRTTITETSVEGHMTQHAAQQGHAETVSRFRAAPARATEPESSGVTYPTAPHITADAAGSHASRR